MQSLNFIRQAKQLISDIQNQTAEQPELQREMDRLFAGLTNPTLPSASRLVQVAQSAGLNVADSVKSKIAAAENVWHSN